MLANTGKALSIMSSPPPSIGATIPPLDARRDQYVMRCGEPERRPLTFATAPRRSRTRSRALCSPFSPRSGGAAVSGESVPSVPKISGVHLHRGFRAIIQFALRRDHSARRTHPYSMAHMVCGARSVRDVSVRASVCGRLTVTLRLIPTVLARTAHGCCATTKTAQNSAVTKVLAARDPRRPSRESTRCAPSCAGAVRPAWDTESESTHDRTGAATHRVHHDVPEAVGDTARAARRAMPLEQRREVHAEHRVRCRMLEHISRTEHTCTRNGDDIMHGLT